MAATTTDPWKVSYDDDPAPQRASKPSATSMGSQMGGGWEAPATSPTAGGTAAGPSPMSAAPTQPMTDPGTGGFGTVKGSDPGYDGSLTGWHDTSNPAQPMTDPGTGGFGTVKGSDPGYDGSLTGWHDTSNPAQPMTDPGNPGSFGTIGGSDPGMGGFGTVANGDPGTGGFGTVTGSDPGTGGFGTVSGGTPGFPSGGDMGQAPTDPLAPQQRLEQDQKARGVYNDLEAAGHKVSWSGHQLMVDGRPYDVAGAPGSMPPGGGGGMGRMTNDQGIDDGPVTGWRDGDTFTPTGTVDGDGGSNSPGAGIPWDPGSQAPSSAPPGMHWDPSMANFEPDAPAAPGSSATKPSGGNVHDPGYAAQLVAYYANQPGANPSLKNDPNYWIQKITSGELGSDEGYIIGKFMTPEGAPAGSSGPGSAPGLPGNMPTVTDPNAGWNPSFSEPTFTPPTITPYQAPTAPWGPNGPTSYHGGTVDNSDIPNFTPQSLLDQLQGTGSAQSLDKLITGLTDSQGPLDQHTIDTIKAQQKDALAEQQQFEDQNIKGIGGSMGLGDSPWLASQRASSMFDRDRSIASTNAGIDVDAAKTNYAARQANAGIGMAYQNARTAQLMGAVDKGLQRSTIEGNRQALQASIDQAAAASGQSAQKIAADWIQHNVDAATAKELAAAGIQLDYAKLNSANMNHLQDLMMAVQQLKSSTAMQSQNANLGAFLQKYGIDVNDKQFGAKYGLDLSGLQHQFENDDWAHSFMDTNNL